MILYQALNAQTDAVRLRYAEEKSWRIPVPELAVVQFDIFAKAERRTAVIYPSLSFYNSEGNLLMRLDTRLGCDTSRKKTGNYTESPVGSSYMTITVKKDSSDNDVLLNGFSYELLGVSKREPKIDVDEYMKPFWRGDTVFNETVLLYSESGRPAAGRLFYDPSKIISVRSFDLQTSYRENIDFSFSNNVITAKPGSSISIVADTFFQKTDLAWYELQSKWVVVTYVHKDRWNYPLSSYKGAALPHTLSRLKNKKPLHIAAYGMSITRGMNVSGFDSVAPFMPPYVRLFADQLKKHYHNDHVELFNAALPGATAEWGAENVKHYIMPLKPDLVILDFGMNDFWSRTPDEFRGYMTAMMDSVKSVNEHAEFMLLANMRFDPDYILDSDTNKITYLRNFDGYRQVMMDLQREGVLIFDMITLSEAIYKRKKAKDCIANPLHPNDYLARWYAQGMSALLIPDFGEK
jgi:hypothetical protein